MNITFDLEVLSNMYCGYTIKEIANLLDKNGFKYDIKEGYTPTPFYIDYMTTIKDRVEPIQEESNEYIQPLQEQKMSYVHYELLKQYTEDAQNSTKPWQHWKFKFKDSNHWLQVNGPLYFHPDREYKREVTPVALTTEPKIGEKYFVPQISTDINMYAAVSWTGSVEDYYLLQNKLAFATSEEASMVANAMMYFVHKTYGNNQ